MVNGQKIKGEKYVLKNADAELIMGKCPSKFRLSWNPVVFTFSFTSKELPTGPLQSLQERFEHLDIKLLTEYNIKHTTHVISKKRNTAKGLQALINAKFIVAETFLDAIVEAATLPEDGGASLLEQDYQLNWPDAKGHLPPQGAEKVFHPNEHYAPDPARIDIFEGYTFVFYDFSQYNTLLAPITNGGGKALLEEVTHGETQVNDFVRFVKGVAGEKGLGSFDDGNDGKGVVLVRYVPSKGEQMPWYFEFFTAVSLLLDHRPIEQGEFLEAILVKDASILRRPLEIESIANTQEPRRPEVANNVPPAGLPEEVGDSAPHGEMQAAPRRGRIRRTVKRRFAGFDDGSDDGMEDTPQAPPQESIRLATDAALPEDEEGGLFVSQEQEPPHPPPQTDHSLRLRGKRAPLSEDDLMADMAPAAARFKRQRLEMGDFLKSPTPEPEPQPEVVEPETKKKPKKKELDILAVVAQNLQEAEALAAAEKEDLATLHIGVDLAEIRRLNIVEEMPLRQITTSARTREQDIADGRWDPKWNGIKNFKKFQRRGEVLGRQTMRSIVPLTEVRNKEFGVGDDYWLEDEDSLKRKKKPDTQVSAIETQDSPSLVAKTRPLRSAVDDSEDEDLESVSELIADSGRKSGRTATQTRTSQSTRPSQSTGQAQTRGATSQSTTQSSGKRPATSPAKETVAKRARPARKAIEIADSDDSDDELKFRFGKRR